MILMKRRTGTFTHMTYQIRGFVITVAFLLFIWPASAARSPLQEKGAPATAPRRDGQHDFDFDIGTWKTHLRRLVHPLTGSTIWVEYEGTTVVCKVWGSRGELEADGFATLRLSRSVSTTLSRTSGV